jgi:hypothetical protein
MGRYAVYQVFVSGRELGSTNKYEEIATDSIGLE